ncbi:MAG: hypothetical protein J3R72DRAFT_454389 [Linnemannia gamsii]|nr:MAG: hypothetical protein J3R72DRAFT_454389 [Linnemannia gamsii]
MTATPSLPTVANLSFKDMYQRSLTGVSQGFLATFKLGLALMSLMVFVVHVDGQEVEWPISSCFNIIKHVDVKYDKSQTSTAGCTVSECDFLTENPYQRCVNGQRAMGITKGSCGRGKYAWVFCPTSQEFYPTAPQRSQGYRTCVLTCADSKLAWYPWAWGYWKDCLVDPRPYERAFQFVVSPSDESIIHSCIDHFLDKSKYLRMDIVHTVDRFSQIKEDAAACLSACKGK